jgi:hypothetical protein
VGGGDEEQTSVIRASGGGAVPRIGEIAFPLTLLLIWLLAAASCGNPNSQAVFDPVEGHPEGFASGHASAAADNADSCTQCHGKNLDGGTASVSCTSCHLGSPGSIHPTDWGASAYALHGEYVTQNGTSSCTVAVCHGADLGGAAGPSCTSCHLGSPSSIHPTDWGTSARALHGAYAAANGTDSCAVSACHGATLEGVPNSGPSCTACHLGGISSIHPTDWGTLAYALHDDYVKQNGTDSCAVSICHGTDLAGATGPSCTSCHIGGISSIHPIDWGPLAYTLHDDYVAANGTDSCAASACHGATLEGVPNSGPSCTSCHLGSPGSIHPTDWGASAYALHGEYVTQNGTSSCTVAVCHGADLGGAAGPSCTACHLGSPSSIHPVDWGTVVYALHDDYVKQNGTDSCALSICHGTDLAGATGPSCTACHLGGISSIHPTDWGTSAYALHDDYVATNGTDSCAVSICHGATLEGVSSSGPSCSACHLGGPLSVHPVDWDAFTLSGAEYDAIIGSAGPPVNWAAYTYALHDGYVKQNGTTSCALSVCHGADLAGATGPSCTACHIGGPLSYHPPGWTPPDMSDPDPDNWIGGGHDIYVWYSDPGDPDASTCRNAACHGVDANGVFLSGPSCYECHPWISWP